MSDATSRVDMHVKVLDERVVDRAKTRGLDALVYAPHFTRLPEIRQRAAQFTDEDLLVIPAREVFTGDWRTRRHVLAVGLDRPVPDFITLEGAVDAVRRQGAALLVPHPEFMNVSLDRATIRRHAEAIDAVEVYNAKCFGYQNRRGSAIVRETGHCPFGSSYAHLRQSVGEAWTEFDRPIDSPADLVRALRDREPRRVVHRTGLSHRLRKLLEFSHLGFENSWGKVDRLFLSGMEPTHPGQVAYRGRFDDVRVY